MPRRRPTVLTAAAFGATVLTAALTCGVTAAGGSLASGPGAPGRAAPAVVADRTPATALASGTTTTKAAPLIDGGGKVVAASRTFAIWWGPTAGFPADERTAMEQILAGFGGSSYLAIANQYLRGATATSTFAGSLVDTSAPPSKSLSVADLAAEVTAAVSAGHVTPGPSDIYLVFTTNFVNGGSCAWHSSSTIGSALVQLAYLPNTSGVKACDAGTPFGGWSEGTRSVMDSSAHELMEAVTDAVPGTAWKDKNGAEIGDKCNATVGPVVLGTTTWYLQPEWSNSAQGCVLGA